MKHSNRQSDMEPIGHVIKPSIGSYIVFILLLSPIVFFLPLAMGSKYITSGFWLAHLLVSLFLCFWMGLIYSQRVVLAEKSIYRRWLGFRGLSRKVVNLDDIEGGIKALAVRLELKGGGELVIPYIYFDAKDKAIFFKYLDDKGIPLLSDHGNWFDR
jgi:hypothetical protein